MPITIEQIDREEAIDDCPSCAFHLQHIHHYIVSKHNKFKTFEECYVNTRDRMVKYAKETDDQDFHSFTGGKFRAEFLHPENIRNQANNIWKEDNYTLSAEKLVCESLMDDEVTEIVGKGNFKGFVKTISKINSI